MTGNDDRVAVQQREICVAALAAAISRIEAAGVPPSIFLPEMCRLLGIAAADAGKSADFSDATFPQFIDGLKAEMGLSAALARVYLASEELDGGSSPVGKPTRDSGAAFPVGKPTRH